MGEAGKALTVTVIALTGRWHPDCKIPGCYLRAKPVQGLGRDSLCPNWSKDRCEIGYYTLEQECPSAFLPQLPGPGSVHSITCAGPRNQQHSHWNTDKCEHNMLRARRQFLASSTNWPLALLSDVTFLLFHSSCPRYLDMSSFPIWGECLLRPFPNTGIAVFILRNWTLGFKESGENEAHVELNAPLEHPYTSDWSGHSHSALWGAVKEKQQCLSEGGSLVPHCTGHSTARAQVTTKTLKVARNKEWAL